METSIEKSTRLPDAANWLHACPDPKDTPFLALAHASGAWLVTGNSKHFPEPVRRGVRVISPGEYLAHLVNG
jgi:predicted nucleic acid-binding protein